jgi:hypothetical protein
MAAFRIIIKYTPWPIRWLGRFVIVGHLVFWGVLFQDRWNDLPLDQKLIWIFFFNNTLAVVTIFEVFLLKKFH